jgi:hypothetical protein
MWTNNLISHGENEIIVEFTTPDNRKFQKIYRESVSEEDIDSLLGEKLNNVEIKTQTYDVLKTYIGVVDEIINNWNYKIINVRMQYDYIELFVDVYHDNVVYSKNYSIFEPRDINYVNSFIELEKNKIINYINSNDVENLSDFLGGEVTL